MNLKEIDVFCPKESCADIIKEPDGTLHYQKRKMNFSYSTFYRGHAIYVCPICGEKRRFKSKFHGYKEIT
jgi:hypothetical protein